MNDMRQTSFPGRKPLPTGETALRQKSGLAWVSILLVLCLVAGMVPVFSQQTQVSAAASFSDHVIDTVTNMEGVTVNLFDYWVKNSNNGADGYRNTNEGINYNKELRFGTRTNDDTKYDDLTGNGLYINGFDGKIIPGIVEENLGADGYPVIAKERQFLDTNHSLSYLFNPDDTSMENYRNTYENATGLFQIDNQGYYYYDANKNYAEYDTTDRRFYVYDTWGVENESQDQTDGQFFPFDPASEAFYERRGTLYQNGINCTNVYLNHYFGFTLEAEFLQPQNGQVTIGDRPQDMTFDFSGDDDVWVFIDGVLVLDIGGIHNKASGSINFATGEVVTTSNVDNDTADTVSRTTLKACFNAAGKDTTSGFDGNTFADNTYHTLSFFYLERGATASNMMLKFNLDTRPVNQILKMDEKGTPISGITYNLYEATVDNNGTYTKKNETVLATLTTDSDGYATFLEEDGTPFNFNDSTKYTSINGQYHFILEEEEVPEGYRSTGDIWLRFDPETSSSGGQLLVSNQWQTGAMANYSFVGTQSDLTWGNDNRKPNRNQSVADIAEDGTMFAVVLMKDETDPSGNTWVPLYGNNTTGWNIQQPISADSDDVISAVITAARNQENQRNDTVICEKNQQGQWEVTLDQLPGDITQYYYADPNNPENAKYIVTFYASSAGSLETADASNTWLVSTSSFEREFSANIWIPNIRNMFQVQKLDASGNPINSGTVSYALYESEPIWNSETNQWESSNGTDPYDTVTNLDLATDNPVAVFGLDGNSTGTKPLVTGETYYLVETAAPEGYVRSTQVVKIVVDNTGVHADAGIANDDVTVAVGAGYLLKPMEKFGANDAIDATLHDIKGVVQTGTLDGTSGTSITWNEVSDTSGSTELHLQYGIDGNLLQYGPTNGGNPYLTYDSGFGRLYIEQCTEETHNPGTHKDNIETAINDNAYYAVNGITPLFTGSTTVQIKNHPEIQTGDVTVTKTVTGLQNLNQDTFPFTIKFEVPSGSSVTIPSTVNYTISDNSTAVVTDGTSGTVTVGDDDSIAFTLKNGDSVTFKDLPEGLRYTIMENLGAGSNLKYTYSSSITAKDKNDQDVTDTDSGDGNTAFSNRVPAEDSVTVTYTNTATPVSFNFTKVDGSNNNAKLSGAGFTLYRWDGTGKAPENGLVSGTGSGGWTVIDLDADSNKNELVTTTNGAVNITGLYPDATYRLVETTTPGGYIAPQGQWQLTYVGTETTAVNYNGWTIELITEDGALNKAPAFGVDGSTLYLPNYQVPEIPVTGGEGGGWMFYGLTGTLLVGGAVLTLFAFSRRRKHF